MADLTPKQAAFVREYLVDLNATQAAIRAGYSPNGARVQGCRLLAEPNIAAEIKAAQDKRARKTEITAEKVLADIERISVSAEAVEDFGAALKGKELLGKHLGMWVDRQEVSGAGGGPLQVVVQKYGEGDEE